MENDKTDNHNHTDSEDQNHNISQLLYDKVIYPNRYFFGLWRADLKTYGGLLLVKCVSGGVEGWELRAPTIKNFMSPLRVRPLFRICMSEDDQDFEQEVRCLCLGQPVEVGDTQHGATVQMTTPDEFEFHCQHPESHLKSSRKNPYMLAWIDEERGYTAEEKNSVDERLRYEDELLKRKFLGIRNCRFQYSYRRVDISSWDKEFGFGRKPIESGLFKGTYNGMGVEIVQLTYEVNSKGEPEAKALKITGDPYVPAKKMTFKAKLNMPMNLTCKEEQYTIARLEAREVDKMPYRGHSGEPKAQPFILPKDCTVDYNLKVPRFCKYRFIGWGQTAEDGFENTNLCKGHWVVFNDDLFGFLFLDLLSLSLYHRVNNLDPDPPLPSHYSVPCH